MKKRGFVLLSSLLVVFMMLSFVSLLLLKTEAHIRTSRYAQNQMRSISLAEGGLEEARKIIAENPIAGLLKGADGTIYPTGEERIPDPVGLMDALTCEAGEWEIDNDDGFFAFHPGKDSAVLIRISNDREEQPWEDRDGKLLVRSMGIVRSPLLEAKTSVIKNQVTILEGYFRKEKGFLLPSPLVLLDRNGGWSFTGNNFEVSGGKTASITLLGSHPECLAGQLSNLTDNEKKDNFTGAARGVATHSGTGDENPGLGRLLPPEFWMHFRTNIEQFGIKITTGELEGLKKGLYIYSGGSRLRGDIGGVLVTAGDVILDSGFNLQGLLIHLGNGKLILAGNCRITGGLLYSAAGADEDSGLELGERARVVYSEDCLEEALECLPVTHLGTRIVNSRE